MAFRVKDAAIALKHAQANGAVEYKTEIGPMELSIPAVIGIGDSLLYFVDRYGDRSIYDVDFHFYPDSKERLAKAQVGLYEIDHLTHNVKRGNMNLWAGFYERIGNFREIRYFDIEGKLTGLVSRAMTAPVAKSVFRSTSPLTINRKSKSLFVSTKVKVSSISRSVPRIFTTL